MLYGWRMVHHSSLCYSSKHCWFTLNKIHYDVSQQKNNNNNKVALTLMN